MYPRYKVTVFGNPHVSYPMRFLNQQTADIF